MSDVPVVHEPAQPLLTPVLVPARPVLGRDEVLHLHHFELTRPEDEVARGDLVPERLADLGDAERRLLAGSGLDVEEVHEDALGGFGAQVGNGPLVLHRADVGLEHQVEATGLGERALGAAVGAGAGLGQVVGPEALFAVPAVDERVGERLDVAARLPDPGVHEDGGVEADDVVPQLDHRPPPGVLDVALQEDAEGPVIPGRPEAAVDLAGREDEAAPLAQVDHALHEVRLGHPTDRTGATPEFPSGNALRRPPAPHAPHGPTPLRLRRASARSGST